MGFFKIYLTPYRLQFQSVLGLGCKQFQNSIVHRYLLFQLVQLFVFSFFVQFLINEDYRFFCPKVWVFSHLHL